MSKETEFVQILTDEGSALVYINNGKYGFPHPDNILIEGLLVEKLPIVGLNVNDGRSAADFLADLNEHVGNCERCEGIRMDFTRRIKRGTKDY